MHLHRFQIHLGVSKPITGCYCDRVSQRGNLLIGIHDCLLTSGGYCNSDGKAVLPGIRQETHRNDQARDNCQNHNPERWLLIVHYRLDPLLDTNLAKGKGTGRNPTVIHTAGQKRLRVISSLLVSECLNDLFITGKLNIPAQKDIGNPHQWIKPVDGQQQEAKGLPPVVFAANMGLLMGDNVPQILPIHFERQIDSRPEDAQHKGRVDIFTLEDVISVTNGRIQLAAQAPVAGGGVDKEYSNPNQPDNRKDGNPDLQRVCAGYRSGGEHGADNRIDHTVDCADPAVNGRGCRHFDVHGDGFRAGDQAPCTLKRERANQPNSDDAPEQDIAPFGGFLQHQAEYQHSQNQPACGNAHIDDFQKQFAHCLPPFRMRSIMRCTSSNSFSDKS